MPSPPLSIVQPLSPRVAILSSDEVKFSCEANGCRGLEELLRPWEGGIERVSVLSSTLTPTIHPSFPLRFVTFESIFPNPAVGAPLPDLVVDMIGSYVGDRRPDEEQHYPLARSLLLASRPVATYETFNHPVGMLFAISTSDPDPLTAMRRLVQLHFGATQTIPWLDAVSVLKFYVVVHDVARQGEDLSLANEILASVKKTYGPHSTMLVVNSRTQLLSPPPSPDVRTHPAIPLPRPLTPDEPSATTAISQIYASALSSLTLSPMSAAAEAMGEQPVSNTPSSPSQPARRKLYGAKLSAEDTQRLVALVRELVVQSLIPWMEARVREWNEVYHANRRGITGRLFGAGRKLFGGKPAGPAPTVTASGYNTVKGYYPIVAVESLTRRLADFAFMLRDYRFASGIYDSLRRDFAQDRALRHSAAATEMYGLSLLLSHPYFMPTSPPRQLPLSPFTTLQHTDIASWLEQAVAAYYGAGVQLDAMRATLLYYEAWKMVGEWRGVGAALVRAAGEAEEVVGAVLIEEAAQADLRGGKDPNGRGKRRRAFHLVVAGRRYETAGLKSYSRRCLTRAAEIYRPTPWTATKDRIEYSLGRQAYASGEMVGAVKHFLSLLGRDDTGVPGSQEMPLQDMGLAYEQLVSHPDQLEEIKGSLQLPTPVIDVKQTRIITSENTASGSRDPQKYADLETKVLEEWDRKGKKPMRLLRDSTKILVNSGDAFHIELHVTNPLNTSLMVTDLTVQFTSPSIDMSIAEIQTLDEISLDAYETRIVRLSVSIPSAGSLTLDSASFLFHQFLPCTQSLTKRGKRLYATKAQKLTPAYGSDSSLRVDIVEGRPGVDVELVWENRYILEGEEVEMEMRIRNTGPVTSENLEIFVRDPGSLRLRENESDQVSSNELKQSSKFKLGDWSLEAGSEKMVPIIFTARATGPVTMDGLVIGNNENDVDQIACSRLSESVVVLPAIELLTRIKSTADMGGYNILVETRNRSNRPIRLDGLSSVSPYWVTKGANLEGAVLLPNQAYRVVLPIYPPETASGIDLDQVPLVEALSSLVQGSPTVDPIEHSPIAELSSATDSASYIASRRRFRFTFLKNSFPTLSSNQLADIFPLIDPLDLDLILTWSFGDDRKGHTYAYALRPSPAYSLVNPIHTQVQQALLSGSKEKRTMYEETGRLRRVLVESVLEGVLAVEEDPIEVRMKVNGAVKGVMRVEGEGGLRGLDVQIEVRNRSPAVRTRWSLKLPSASSEKQIADPSRNQATFLGSQLHTGTLGPNMAELVKCKVMVAESGMIELSGWTLEVETGDMVGDEWRPRMNWTRTGSGGSVQVNVSQD